MDAGKMKKSGGYSLVEVMVAMVISLIILSGVYKTITDETVKAAREEAVLDMQNNARAAITRIAADLRRTGFFGCGGQLTANTTAFAYPPVPIVFSNDDTTAGNIDDGTDSITLQFIEGDVPLDPAAPSTSDPSFIKDFVLARPAFAANDILLITDCGKYAIFQKTNPLHVNILQGGNDLKWAYGAPDPARVYTFGESEYRVNGAGLMYNDQEIAENIEDLQFEFIEDLDGDGDLNDENWTQTFTAVDGVRAVKVWVLAMSDTAYSYTDNNTYDYPNSPYHSGTTIPPISTNGVGGSPASQAPLADDREYRYRYLASGIIYLRNAAI